jgi:acetyl-CoA C-acetyltransferase
MQRTASSCTFSTAFHQYMTGKSIMSSIVIASAARTPVGSFNGALSSVAAHELGAVAIKAALERAGVDAAGGLRDDPRPGPDRGPGPEPRPPGPYRRRPAAGSAAWGINQVCGSGLRAVALGAQHIMLGDAAIVVAGGQESMSLSTSCVSHLRNGTKMGDVKFIDSMIKDGLWDAFNGYHDGQHRRERRQPSGS